MLPLLDAWPDALFWLICCLARVMLSSALPARLLGGDAFHLFACAGAAAKGDNDALVQSLPVELLAEPVLHCLNALKAGELG